MVNTASDVKTRIMTPKEAVEKGALAMFGEKYDDEVRVLSMGKENGGYFSTELCGGTHVKNTSEIGKFAIVSQSSIAAGVRRVEALRGEQLSNFLNKIKTTTEKATKATQENINEITKHIKSKNIKPVDVSNLPLLEQMKKLTKQMNEINIQLVIDNKNKNVIKDKKIGSFTLRNQVLTDFPPKELRRIIDQGKKDIKKGIVVGFAIHEEKIGVAIGVTKELTEKYDSVKLVQIASQIIGGKGGGGRKDFAQAGGVDKNKIEEAFKTLSKKIN